MRICLVCRGYPTQRPGGMLFVCQDRAEALAAMGHDVFVLTTGAANGKESTIVSCEGRLTVMHLPCEPLAYSAEFGRQCAEAVARLHPKVLHLDSFDRNCPWWSSYEGGLRAVTMHGFGWGSLLTRWQMFLAGDSHVRGITQQEFVDADRERQALAGFDRRITISRHEHWLMGETYGLSSHLIYNPIAPAFFRPLAPLPTCHKVFLAAAISGHSQRGFHGLESLARKAGVKVRIVTDVPRSMMPDQYDSVHGLLLPTRYCQGYDLAVAESLARGRPVIASAVGSYYAEAAEFLPGLTVVPPGDQEAWMAAMLRAPQLVHGGSGRHRPECHAALWLDSLNP